MHKKCFAGVLNACYKFESNSEKKHVKACTLNKNRILELKENVLNPIPLRTKQNRGSLQNPEEILKTL